MVKYMYEDINNQDAVGETYTTADRTQDILNIDSGNYWTRIDIVNDNIKLSHSVRDIDVESNGTTNFNIESGAKNEENINIPDWDFDAAGHIIAKKNHTYTLPFGFKTIKTNGIYKGVNGEYPQNANIEIGSSLVVADNTQDELALDSGNEWIRIEAEEIGNSDTITFSHDIHYIDYD